MAKQGQARKRYVSDLTDEQWAILEPRLPSSRWVLQQKGEHMEKFYKIGDRACKDAGISGKVAHDFRRTAVRNLGKAGVPERIAVTITEYKTCDIFDRYDIVSAGDQEEAARKIDE